MASDATVLRTGFKEMGTNQPWNWRLTVHKTIKMTLVRPPITNLKVTVRADCAVSACSQPPTSVYKRSYPPVTSGGEWGVSLWTDVCPPSAHLPASEIKQTFLSTDLAYFMALGQWAVLPTYPFTTLTLIYWSNLEIQEHILVSVALGCLSLPSWPLPS